jgi:hypothetical protein
MMEMIRSFETSVLTIATLRNIPEDGILEVTSDATVGTPDLRGTRTNRSTRVTISSGASRILVGA